LLFFQNGDGSFVHKYDSKGVPVAHWHSPYYSGEAALALAYLYEIDHSPEWLMASGKALSYLAKAQAHLFRVPSDHWALIATAKLFPDCALITCGISRSELIRHAAQICSSILDEQLKGTAVDGAFDQRGRTAPAATRLEGLYLHSNFCRTMSCARKLKRQRLSGLDFFCERRLRLV
jgi:hypothetical protein